MQLKTILITFLIGMISGCSFSQTDSSRVNKFPNYVGYVNDFENIFTIEQIAELNEIITKHEQETSNQIVVVSIKSYEPYESIFDYGLHLSNFWGVGQKDKNNGLAIIFGIQIREVTIQVGKGLESKISDEDADKIIQNTMIPEFKKGDYFEGVKKGLKKLIKEVE